MPSFFKMFQSNSRRTSKPSLRLESFEERWVPAQVTATVSGGVLTIVAQDASSSEGLSIENGSTPGEFFVVGAPAVDATPTSPAIPATTINFGKLKNQSSQYFTGINSVNLLLKGGADNVSVQGIKILGNLSIDGGSGGNTIAIKDSTINGSVVIKNGNCGVDDVKIGDSTNQVTIGKALTVIQGAGANDSSLSVSGARVFGAVKIVGGAGKDNVTIDNSDLRSNLSVATAAGDDQFVATNVKVSLGAAIALGAGANSAVFRGDEVGLGFSVVGGASADSVTIEDVKVYGGTTFNLGEGDDVIKTDVSYFAGSVSYNLGNGNNQLGIDSIVAVQPGNPISGTTIAGNLSIISGTGIDTVSLGGTGNQLSVSGTTSLSLGSEVTDGDILTIDDVVMSGSVKIDLGSCSGNDTLLIEERPTAISNRSIFQKDFKVLCGGGNDKVVIGDTATGGTYVVFAGKTLIDGGTNRTKLPKENDTIDPADFVIGNGSSQVFYKNFETVLSPIKTPNYNKM